MLEVRPSMRSRSRAARQVLGSEQYTVPSTSLPGVPPSHASLNDCRYRGHGEIAGNANRVNDLDRCSGPCQLMASTDIDKPRSQGTNCYMS